MPSKKVLVVGGLGAMGVRYRAIMEYLRTENVCADISDDVDHLGGITHAIVATPIDTHVGLCVKLLGAGYSVLCEKPVSKSIDEIETLQAIARGNNVSCHMVCNWKFVLGTNKLLEAGQNTISLNYYNTGKDGDWDLIQPIYLSRGFPTVKRTSPYYDCGINGKLVNQVNFDLSYVSMIGAWLNAPHLLWTLDDAIKATKKTIEYMDRKDK